MLILSIMLPLPCMLSLLGGGLIKPTKGRVVGEGLHNHGLLWNQLDDGGVSRLDKLGVVLKLLARTTVDLLDELLELASNVSGVAVQHGGVALVDLAWVVQDDDL